MGSDLSLFHARWAAPEVWQEYIEEEFFEGKKLNLSNLITVQSLQAK